MTAAQPLEAWRTAACSESRAARWYAPGGTNGRLTPSLPGVKSASVQFAAPVELSL